MGLPLFSFVVLISLSLCSIVVSPVSGATRSFLHITDIHWDPYYVVGSPEGTLCHADSRLSTLASDGTAGPYGDRSCDTPSTLVTAALNFAQSLGPLDFVVWTGDNARHDRDPAFPTTLDQILGENTRVAQWMQQAFPSLQLIPSIGNNDVYPHDSIGEGPNNPILTNLTGAWAPWLGPAARQTMLEGGYFATQVMPGLSVISLNTLYWAQFNDNVKSCEHGKSPGARQLEWLESTLSNLRAGGQKAYLVGHVPPHSQYFPTCLKSYGALASAYADVIVGHLYGHKHEDVLYVLDDDAAAILVAPSVLPQYNPAVRVIQYDNETFALMNVITYYANLDDANAKGRLTWSREYDMVSAFGLEPPLTTAQLALMKKKIDTDPAFEKLYTYYRFVSSGATQSRVIPGHPNC